jgi:hypothetical protein
MTALDPEHDVDDIPCCNECRGVLQVELWVFHPRDIALLHVCSRHGLAAISRPFA